MSLSDMADKSIVGTLMSMLITMKFDGGGTMHEHFTEMKNIALRLKFMGLEVNGNFLIQFIMNFLSPQYGPFQINYNTIEDKWNVTEFTYSRGSNTQEVRKSLGQSCGLGHKKSLHRIRNMSDTTKINPPSITRNFC